MSVKAILQGQSYPAGMKYNSFDDLFQLLPEVPDKPVQIDEEIPYTWEQINAIAVTGQTPSYIEVGAIKTIQLDYPLLDTQDLIIRYIGLDIDQSNERGTECMVFQADCLNRPISYIKVDTKGDMVSIPQGWKNSNVRQKCQEFYQALPFKNYIQSLNKGTCYEISEDRGARVSYNKELVWLLSEQEMGGDQYSPLAISNANKEWGEATFGRNESEPYEYYTLGDYKNKGMPYWLRSNAYDSFNGACIIDDTEEFNVEDGRQEYGFTPAFAIGIMQGNITQNEEDITSKVSDAIGLAQHIGDTGNPHNVTAFQIGAPSWEEFTSMDRTVSDHVLNTNNPHKVTAAQLGAALSTDLKTHTNNSTIHVTSTEKNKIAKAVTTSGVVYNSPLPAKPSTPIAADVQIPYSWEELNIIALSGQAADYVSVGAIKSVTLNEAVLGTTTHDVRIIGINQDNDQSITFQTKNCLANTAIFGSNAQWIGSTARTECQNYYNAFPGKAAIKTVKKGTCPFKNDNRNGDVTYNNETVWILSEREMGIDRFSSLSMANSSTSKAECTQGKNFAYSYYTSSSRIKTLGDSGSISLYWERSCSPHAAYSNGVCYVSSSGAPMAHDCSSSFGLAPAFVIGNGEPSKGTLTQDGEDITNKIKELVGGPKVGNITKNVTLLDVADGTVLTFKENGVDTNFVKLQSNYEGSGRVAVIRQTPLTTTSVFNRTNGATYSYGGSILDTWLNQTYLALLEDSIRNLIEPVDVPINQYTGSNWIKTTISRYCFAPSYSEYGYTGQTGIIDGSELSQLKFLSQKFTASTWMRTLQSTTQAYYFYSSNSSSYANVTNTYAIWPMFTLPADYEIRSYSIPTFVDTDNNDISNVLANASKKQFIKEIITSEEATAIQIDVSDINFNAYDEIIMYTDLWNGKHTNSVSPYCSITINDDTSSIYGTINDWPSSSQNMNSSYIAYPAIISEGSYYNCFTPIIRFVTRGMSTFCQAYYGYQHVQQKTYYISLSSGVYPTSLVSIITITPGNTSYNSIAAGSKIRIWGTRK